MKLSRFSAFAKPVASISRIFAVNSLFLGYTLCRLAKRLRTTAACFDSSSRMAEIVSVLASETTCSAYCVPPGRAGSKPSLLRCSSALVTCGLGLLSVMRCMPAFSKNWLYLAITATASTQGVPACGSVSLTSFAPKPMLLYFGWITTRLMVLISCCSCFRVPFQAWLLPKHVGVG